MTDFFSLGSTVDIIVVFLLVTAVGLAWYLVQQAWRMWK
jgi:hypothetical protein